MRYFLLLSLGLFFSWSNLASQNNRWTLESSIAYALENNLQVKQLRNQAMAASYRLKGDRLQRLPNISASGSLGRQFGRTIDPSTNAFVQQGISFNSYNLQASVLLYNGNRINNSIKQSIFDEQAADFDAESTANDIALNVANAYLTILLAREQLANAQAQLSLTDGQLSQTEAAIRAGSLPEVQRYDLIAQKAANQRTVVELQNQVKLALVNLQLLLELDPSDDFNITTPNLDIREAYFNESYNYEEIIFTAQALQPAIKAANMRRNSALVGQDLAKAGFYPTISVFGSLSTNASSAARSVNRDNVTFVPSDPLPVIINGEGATISNFVAEGIVFEDVSFFDQIGNNFGQGLGLSLNIPIYSQGRNKIAVQQAGINRLNAELQYEQAVNQLQNDITRALTEWRAARENYQAAATSLEASEAAYAATKRRFDLGGANNLELLTATNRLDQAKTEQIRAKYQLIFNRQVLQFYLGQPLKLE